MGASATAQARALFAKSAVYQRRNTATNVCLVAAPIFFCGLLLLLQILANTLLLNQRNNKCGCQCLECCFPILVQRPWTNAELERIAAGEFLTPRTTRVEQCFPMTTGYCERYRNSTCRTFNDSNCGIRYSSPRQAIFCSIVEPSSWPPTLHTPRPMHRAGGTIQQWLPFTGSNMTAARAVAANLAIEPELPNIEPIAQVILSNPLAVLNLPPAKILELVFSALVPRGLVNEAGDSVDAAQLSRLALSFGSGLWPYQDYYLDNAFINSNSNSSRLQLLLPFGQCDSTGLANVTNYPTYPLPDILLRYYTARYPRLIPPLLRLFNLSADNLTSSLSGTPLEGITTACVDLLAREAANTSHLNRRLYCGFGQARCDGTYFIREYGAAWDFSRLGPNTLEYIALHNLSLPAEDPPNTYRIPQILNMATQAWTSTYWGNQLVTSRVRNRLMGLMSFPKLPFSLKLDFSVLLGPLFYTWVIQMLMPSLLQQLVYEKEKRLRIMMKMHGLGDGAYWLVTYLWYLMLYVVYMCFFVFFGTVIRLKIFTTNSYSLQAVLYFIFGNNMIAFMFMLSSLFSSSRTSTVVAFLYIFATGLIGELLLRPLMQQRRPYMLAVQLIPGFALYRGLMEFSEYSIRSIFANTPGLKWSNLSDPGNGMVAAWVILLLEWPLFMVMGWYLEQVLSSGTGARRRPLFFLQGLRRKPSDDLLAFRNTLETTNRPTSQQPLPQNTTLASSTSSSAPASVFQEPQQQQQDQPSAPECDPVLPLTPSDTAPPSVDESGIGQQLTNSGYTPGAPRQDSGRFRPGGPVSEGVAEDVEEGRGDGGGAAAGGRVGGTDGRADSKGAGLICSGELSAVVTHTPEWLSGRMGTSLGAVGVDGASSGMSSSTRSEEQGNAETQSAKGRIDDGVGRRSGFGREGGNGSGVIGNGIGNCEGVSVLLAPAGCPPSQGPVITTSHDLSSRVSGSSSRPSSDSSSVRHQGLRAIPTAGAYGFGTNPGLSSERPAQAATEQTSMYGKQVGSNEDGDLVTVLAVVEPLTTTPDGATGVNRSTADGSGCPSTSDRDGGGGGGGGSPSGESDAVLGIPLAGGSTISPSVPNNTPFPKNDPQGTGGHPPSDKIVGLSMDALDVRAEASRVAALDEDELRSMPIVIRGLAKVFEGSSSRGGGGGGKWRWLSCFGSRARPRVAVRNLTLAIERGECFGLLGPNGAGKTTSINMLTGFLEPSAGDALVEGRSVHTRMPEIYRLMGVCPQENLLWEQLTGEEHLLFYGRLKGLKGRELTHAVEAAIKSVKLHINNAGKRRVSAYSGGMKRRLSVAISFIGEPQVVYLDEPSTGLDPASRRALWEVVRQHKDGRAIILTTHSMEEAQILCDRLGIFVDGQLVCIGNPREITSRYAGYLVFTLTVEPGQEEQARAFVTKMSPNARLTYALGSTLKYELPAEDVTLSDVFDAMESGKRTLTVLDWGVAHATLEEVFIKFARQIGAETKEG